MTSATGHWQSLEIAGHACHAYEPAEPSPHGYAVLYLHCVGAVPLAEHPAFERLFDQYGLRCLAPVTGESWWTDRVSPQFDPAKSAERFLLDDVLPWLAEQWAVQPPRIGLLGVSMGGQGALKLAYKYPDKFPVAAAISPAIDYQQWVETGDPHLCAQYPDPEAARQDTATLHIHPLNWPRNQWFCCDPADELWHDGGDRLHMKLYSLGVPHTCDLETTAGGHSWQYYEHMAPAAVKFVHESLESERRRVV